MKEKENDAAATGSEQGTRKLSIDAGAVSEVEVSEAASASTGVDGDKPAPNPGHLPAPNPGNKPVLDPGVADDISAPNPGEEAGDEPDDPGASGDHPAPNPGNKP